MSRIVWMAMVLVVSMGCDFDQSGSMPADLDPSSPMAPDAAPEPEPTPGDPDAAIPTCGDADQDGDGFMALGCGADCDDADDRAHPNQTEFSTVERAGGGFDFDCNNVEEQQYPDRYQRTNTACVSGWDKPQIPECGEVAEWRDCAWDEDDGDQTCDCGRSALIQACR